jgi:hypothetical protein
MTTNESAIVNSDHSLAINKSVTRGGMDSTGSGQGPAAGSCKQVNEPWVP